MIRHSRSILVKQVIEGCTAGLPAQIKYYTQFNQSVKIIDDTLSEVISAAINNTICGGTGGSGWDNEDGDTEICRSPKRTGNGIYTDFLTAVDNNLYISADVGSKFSLENIKVRELTQINKSTDFALYPGQHQIQIPKGLGDDIIFSYLQYNNQTLK